LQDRFLVVDKDSLVNLQLDIQQDWVGVSAFKNATHTNIQAIRRIKTCDTAALAFTVNNNRNTICSSEYMIFTYLTAFLFTGHLRLQQPGSIRSNGPN
jgi:hypothetical protein